MSISLLLALAALVSTSFAKSECDYTYGYAYDFGVNNRITVDPDTYSTKWYPTVAFTYQMWIKPHYMSADRNQQLVGNLKIGEQLSYNHALIITNRTLYLHVGGLSNFQTITAKYDLSDHLFKWTHVTATYSNAGSDQIGKIYINGKLVAEQYNMGRIHAMNYEVYIGTSADNALYTGLMDEIRFFSRALTDNEVEETWNKVLSDSYIKSEDLLFYFTADGDDIGTAIDKSIYNRPAKWGVDPNAGALSNRTNVVANCIGCFSCGTPSFCIPTSSADMGRCGDGIVMGDEECDSGDGCTEDCKCDDNYTAHGLPYCMKNIDGTTTTECPYQTVAARCSSAMFDPTCDCECYKEKSIDCMLRYGCNIDALSHQFFGTWDPCITRCPNNIEYCYDFSPEYCARFTTKDTCVQNECTWCINSCMSMETACPVAIESQCSVAVGRNVFLSLISAIFLYFFLF